MNGKATVWCVSDASLPNADQRRMGALGGRTRKRASIFVKVVSYAGSAKGLTDQLAACQPFGDQHRLDVVERCSLVRAGMREPRSDLTTIKADAERDLFQVLVDTSQDQLCCDASRLVASIQMFKSLGVEVQTVGDGGPASTAPMAARLFQKSGRVGREWRKGND